jgi:hypothetical protein
MSVQYKSVTGNAYGDTKQQSKRLDMQIFLHSKLIQAGVGGSKVIYLVHVYDDERINDSVVTQLVEGE